jgi:hypothetical protein
MKLRSSLEEAGDPSLSGLPEASAQNTGKSNIMKRPEVFGPLGLTSAGFGGTGTPGQLDQPWGHHASGNAASSSKLAPRRRVA